MTHNSEYIESIDLTAKETDIIKASKRPLISSMLPNIYPDHFKSQIPLLFSNESCSPPHCSSITTELRDYRESSFPIADMSEFFEFSDVNDSYRLYPRHIACLAEILNINYENLSNFIRLLSLSDPNAMPDVSLMKESFLHLRKTKNQLNHANVPTEYNNLSDSLEVIGDSQGFLSD